MTDLLDLGVFDVGEVEIRRGGHPQEAPKAPVEYRL